VRCNNKDVACELFPQNNCLTYLLPHALAYLSEAAVIAECHKGYSNVVGHMQCLGNNTQRWTETAQTQSIHVQTFQTTPQNSVNKYL